MNGRIEVEGKPYPDGTIVEFVVRDDDGDLAELTPEQEAAIEEAMAEIDRGDFVTGDELLDQLRAMRVR